MNKIRVRFAPSPTGYLHIGGLRSALYNYLFARKNNGTFILRIEDTDQKRHVEGALENLIKSLEWAGIKYEEGPYLKISNFQFPISNFIESNNYSEIIEAGECKPYIQSERLELYKKYAHQLVKEGKAYYCFCEPERLEKMRQEQIAQKKAPMYDKYCLRNLTEDQINKNLENNCSYTIRLKVPEGETIELQDIIRGKIIVSSDIIDEQVLLKSDGYPTYHLASVVDDHLMKITHVIRGEEWLPSTPKHILLYKAFGWKMPEFAHLPLLLNSDRSKLSKRQGDVSVEEYVKKGYLKEAIINFVTLMGWNPGAGEKQEIFTVDELIEKFDLAKVHKAGAVFDLKKLDWINSQYIKKLPIDDLYNAALPFWKQKEFFVRTPEEKKSKEFLKRVLSIEQDRLTKLSEIGEYNKFFFQDIKYDRKLLSWKDMDNKTLSESLNKSREILNNISEKEWNREVLGKILLEAAGDRRGELLWPLRVALTGEQNSPSPFEVTWVLGKEESIKRINKALKMISQ